MVPQLLPLLVAAPCRHLLRPALIYQTESYRVGRAQGPVARADVSGRSPLVTGDAEQEGNHDDEDAMGD
jgi:hypothetical protein